MNAPAREITERFAELFGPPRVDDPEAHRFYLDWCNRLQQGARVVVTRHPMCDRITVVHPASFAPLSASPLSVS